MLRFCSWFGLVAALATLATPVVATDFTGAVRVIDGDTIDVGTRRVRLHGIDAPERGQPCTTLSGENWGCGDWVTREVRDRYQGERATCVQVDVDRYNRTVARCTVAGKDMGRVLVQSGWAYAYRKYAMDYDLDEKAAYVADLGIHGFLLEAPARYRLTRIKGRTAPDPGCAIKGNISANGSRIYHMPGQEYYQKTGIRPEQGERWFCSEAQARASGWRRSRR